MSSLFAAGFVCFDVLAFAMAAVERVFSVDGYILGPKRMSLSDENFEDQLFSNLIRNVFQVRYNKLKL